MLSCCLIIPTVLQAKANTLAECMGWGSSSYSVPLTNATDITHWGLHAWVEQTFADILTAAGDGVMPQELIDAGYPAADFAAVCSALIVSFQSDSMGHFDEVCATNNLVVVIADDH